MSARLSTLACRIQERKMRERLTYEIYSPGQQPKPPQLVAPVKTAGSAETERLMALPAAQLELEFQLTGGLI